MTLTHKRLITGALDLERERLLSLVETLSDDDLNRPSLCEGWRIRDVLSHLVSFELNYTDILRVLFRLRSVDQVTKDQVERYSNLTQGQLITKLTKGSERTRLVINLVPNLVFSRKFIKIGNGWISPAQLFGDLVADRAIHYVDVSNPVNGTSRIESADTLALTVDFMLSSIYLLNKKLLRTDLGKVIEVNISGKVERRISWQVGSTSIASKTKVQPSLIVRSGADDFIFTITGRKTLVKQSPTYSGDSDLAKRIEGLLSSNAFWD